MNKITKYVRAWFARADDDLGLVKLIFDKKISSPNLACFHAQQAAEKYLKGFLANHEKHTRKIHDLGALLEYCKEIDSIFEDLRKDAQYLSQFYTESRYPDDYIEFSWKEAEQAFTATKKIKNFVLKKIKKQN